MRSASWSFQFPKWTESNIKLILTSSDQSYVSRNTIDDYICDGEHEGNRVDQKRVIGRPDTQWQDDKSTWKHSHGLPRTTGAKKSEWLCIRSCEFCALISHSKIHKFPPRPSFSYFSASGSSPVRSLSIVTLYTQYLTAITSFLSFFSLLSLIIIYTL